MASEENKEDLEPAVEAILEVTPVLKATHGTQDKLLTLGDKSISCYVLENGMRVISGRGMKDALGMRDSRGGFAKDIVGISALQAFISEELAEKIRNPVVFYRPEGGRSVFGYEAGVLVDICDAVLSAREADVLTTNQLLMAHQCEVLTRAFAKVGIIALIDEVTGYQETRARDELHQILEAYISEEWLPWSKRFPDEFYKEIFRLKGWRYDPLSVKRPMLIGKITEDVVYRRLPNGVLDELRERNPRTEKGHRRKKHHQFLTENIGNPHLERHLASLITLMRVSKSWQQFMGHVKQAFPLPGDQLQIDFDDEADDSAA